MSTIHPFRHSSPPSPRMQWLVPWNRGQGTNGGPRGLVCLWKQPPIPRSLINQAGFIESGRVLWCPSHVSFQSPPEGSHGSTFTHGAQGRCACGGEGEPQRKTHAATERRERERARVEKEVLREREDVPEEIGASKTNVYLETMLH